MKRKRKRYIKPFPVVAMVLFLLLSAGIFHVWVSFKRTQTEYSLGRLKKNIVQLEQYNRKLTLEIAFLKSPEHLEGKAMRELGLRHPLPEQIVFLP